MNNFFPEKILIKIKKFESNPTKKKSFLSENECKEFLDYFTNLKNKSLGKSQLVNREESTKIFFDFDQSANLKKLRNKIEENIGDSYTNIYILKHIVNYVRQLKMYYLNKETEKQALKIFKNKTSELICDMVEFYVPKINFEKLFCSLIAISNCIEGIMFSHLEKKYGKKEYEYSNLELMSANHIYGALEVNIIDDYNFNKNSEIIVLDCVNKKQENLQISDEDIERLNCTHALLRGNYLNKIYKINSE